MAGFFRVVLVTISHLPRAFARGYVELGTLNLSFKKYHQAEKAFLKARNLNDDSCASCGLGMTYHRLGRYDEAEEAFRRAINLNGNDVCAYEQSGRMYYDVGKYQEAIAAFKRAVTLRANFANYMYLGNAYVYAREFAAGVDAYKEAIRLNPRDAQGHVQLGIAYDYLDRSEEATEEYKQAIKLNPDDETAHYALAWAYLAMRNKPAALAEYEILRKLNPKKATELLAVSNVVQGRERGKEKLYLIPLSDFSSAWLTRLVTYYEQKRGIKAIATQPVPLELSAIDSRRHQVIAQEAIELMKRRYPKLAADPNAILIGLTDEDMYIREKSSRFAFSYRTQGRFAVVSSARMNPVNLGGSANNDLLDSRMRKMVLKDIAILYYLLPVNHDPRSVLYSEVEAVEDLDKMGEDF